MSALDEAVGAVLAAGAGPHWLIGVLQSAVENRDDPDKLADWLNRRGVILEAEARP